ncbi:MAG: serine hydrolase [Paramuribaculum sp.]|nr:serine hydrolase [Paramuribaculum sp.]
MRINTIIRNALLILSISVPSLFATALAGPRAEKKEAALVSGADAYAWADSVMSGLTLRQRVAQLFIPRIDAFDTPAGHAQLKQMVTKGELGGFLLGKGTVSGYASLIKDAQSVAKVPLLVTLDGEWGLAMRVSDAPRFPYNMGLGAITDPEVLYLYGKEVARECRETGIHVNFAPVLDVNSNPANPVIGYRSFGENPQRVAELGAAYSRGLEDGGVMAVGKHFPGHGDTSVDSHKALPTVDHSEATLNSVDLLPFQRFIDEGLSGIMVGHLRVPALDASGTPASLSNKITTGLLRRRMGFEGLIFTDALAMKGAVAKPGENNCIAALNAGADVILSSASPLTDIDAVVGAVKAGAVSKERVDESCRRLLAAKYRLGLGKPAEISPAAAKKRVTSPLAESVNMRLAAASITALRNNDGLLPLGELGKRDIAVVSIGASAGNGFARVCAKYTKTTAYSADKQALTAAQVKEIAKADVVVVGVFSNSSWAVSSLSSLVASCRNVVPVFFVNPYKMSAFRSVFAKLPTVVVAYDNTSALRSAAAQALFGGSAVSGRFPVNVAGIAKEGDGISYGKSRLGYTVPEGCGFDGELERRIDSIAKACLAAGAFPGCQVVVARKGDVVIDRSYGKLESGGTAAVTGETMYDIASMTKATATVGGLMAAYDEGLFGLDDKVSAYVPGLQGTDKSDLTVRQLLFHESGIPATLNMWKVIMDPASYTGPLTRSRAKAPYTVKIGPGVYAQASARRRTDILSASATKDNDIEAAKGMFVGYATRDTIMNRIYNADLRASKSYHYSCLNFCLLMEMEENITGVDHDQWVDTEIFAPLGAWRTCFRPLESHSASEIAPTERDDYLRKQTVRGYVHDEIAAFSGGVQGNAGLFSTAGDMAKYSQMLLQGGVYGPERILDDKTVKLFTTTKSRGGRRTLGFDMAAGLKSLDESGVGSATYGHTGFTGTCFWIDPQEEIVFVFLSNRINPSRSNSAFSRCNPRGEMLRAVYTSLRH